MAGWRKVRALGRDFWCLGVPGLCTSGIARSRRSGGAARFGFSSLRMAGAWEGEYGLESPRSFGLRATGDAKNEQPLTETHRGTKPTRLAILSSGYASVAAGKTGGNSKLTPPAPSRQTRAHLLSAGLAVPTPTGRRNVRHHSPHRNHHQNFVSHVQMPFV